MSKLDMDRVIAAAENDEEYIGFCIACGAEAYDVEPDARRYECDDCGANKVYGAQEILLSYIGA
jgi:predicted RNA-binding Zn-ribbon protein involved in translation (DUF1610 family)